MKPITILFLIVLNSQVHATDVEWFENEWISDRDSSELANPQYQTVDEQTQNTFSAFFGRMRWLVHAGIITAVHDDGKSVTSEYSLNAIGDHRYELKMTGEKETWRILKSEDGLCGGVITSWRGAKSILETVDTDPALALAGSKMSVESKDLWAEVVPNFVECFKKGDS